MRTDWRECPKGDVLQHWAKTYVTMNRDGYIVLSRKTYERIGEPQAVILLFDKVNSRIGLKPTSPSIRNAYSVAKRGRYGGRLVRAYRLMQEFGIDLPETIQFTNPELDEEGILILDLRTAKVCSRGLAKRKSA